MIKLLSSGIYTLIIRFVSILSKYLLIFYIIGKGGVGVYGKYGYLVTIVSFSVYFLGLDYYTFTTRKIIESENKKVVISEAFSLYIILFSITIPFLVLLGYFGIIEIDNSLFFFILLFEYFSQEFYRILISLLKPISANILVLIKNLFFAIIVYLSFQINTNGFLNDYDKILVLWFISVFFASLYGYFEISKKVGVIFPKFSNMNFNEMKPGLSTSLIFFLGTLSYQSVISLDKIFLKRIVTDEQLGKYIFLWNLIFMLITIIEVGLVGQFLPLILSEKSSGKEYKLKISIFNKMILGISIFFFFFFSLTIKPLLGLLNKENLLLNSQIIIFISISIFFQSISIIPHYNLYIHKKDKEILKSHLFSFFLFLIFSLITYRYMTMITVSVGMVLFSLSLFFIKSYFSRPKYILTN
jgi:O-antigen/teichoic acid export membrane protein